MKRTKSSSLPPATRRHLKRTKDIAVARATLLRLTPEAQLRVCFAVIAQVIPAMVDDAIAARIKLKLDEGSPVPEPTGRALGYTKRAIAFIAGHPGTTTRNVADHLGKAANYITSMLYQKRKDGTIERRDRGWYVR